MNILFDPFQNCIHLVLPATKKTPAWSYSFSCLLPLSVPENRLSSLVDLYKTEEWKRVMEAKKVDVIIPNEGIGFATFDLPALSKRKMTDVFETRFKLCYPNYGDFYVMPSEYSRSQSGTVYLYGFAKKAPVQKLLAALQNGGAKVGNISSFADHYVSVVSGKNAFPAATLIMGKDYGELIISKGPEVLFVQDFGYGYSIVHTDEWYLDSAYYNKNDKSRQYATFSSENFARKIPFVDENIIQADGTKSLEFSRPKELRILKDEPLRNYTRKSNFRKFYSLISDLIAQFAASPWYLPITEITVLAPNAFLGYLKEAAKEDGTITFVPSPVTDLSVLGEFPVSESKLFKSDIAKERRRFDWSKLLTMELGKKKQ